MTTTIPNPQDVQNNDIYDDPQVGSFESRRYILKERFHYMDNIRSLTLLAGVVFHVALSYSVYTQEVWPIVDPQRSSAADLVLWFSHCFRMPLFFVVSGFFAHHLYTKLGCKGFIHHRLRRIALPFIVFWPILAIVTMFTIGFTANTWLSSINLAIAIKVSLSTGFIMSSSLFLYFMLVRKIFIGRPLNGRSNARRLR